MTTPDEVILANDTTCELGEGPIWDSVHELVRWIDIPRGLVLSGRLTDAGLVVIVDETSFGETVGAVAVAGDGSWIVAAAQTLILHRPDEPDAPDRELARVVPHGQARRTNDGKPDPAGRFLIGTLRLDGDSERETLARLEDDATLTPIDDDLTLSNGLGWSPDGRELYSIDSSRQLVYARPYDPATGAVGERRTLIRCEDGYPDGMTTDAEGHLWIAIWGRGEVRRYTPEGELVRVIRVPAPHTTSVAFAGPDLDTLVITTATLGMSEQDLADAPLAGKLFTVRPGVRGLPAPLWNGIPAGTGV